MKSPSQYGNREITASPRQHASRFTSTASSSELLGKSADRIDDENAAQAPAGSHKPLLSSGLEIAIGNTEEQTINSNPGKRFERKRQRDPLPQSKKIAESLVNIHDAAQFLAVSVSTLYGWVWQRRISFVKVGRAVRFDLSDLKKFVDENRIHARVPRKS